MLMPSIFSDNFVDDFFDMPFRPTRTSIHNNELMKTDVKETDGVYELSISLPGVKYAL